METESEDTANDVGDDDYADINLVMSCTAFTWSCMCARTLLAEMRLETKSIAGLCAWVCSVLEGVLAGFGVASFVS